MVPAHDGWTGGAERTGFDRERQVIVDSILAHKVRNVVFIAGDVHWVHASAYDPNQEEIIDFHEFGAGPLSAYLSRVMPVTEKLHPIRLANEAGYHNFGRVSISTTSFEVRIVDDTGDTRFIYHLTAQ